MVLDIIHPESSREYVKKIDTAQVFAFWIVSAASFFVKDTLSF
jgi:hypothetical protein